MIKCKLSKLLILFLVSIMLCVSLLGCNDSKLQEEIEDLKRQIEDLKEKEEQLFDRIEFLEKENIALIRKIAENNLILELTVNKNPALVGDTVEVAATLRNLSGIDIPIEITGIFVGQDIKELEDILLIGIYPASYEKDLFWAGAGIDPIKFTIEKDAVIKQTFEFCIEEPASLKAVSEVSFHIGSYDHRDSLKGYVYLRTEPLVIFVEE